MTVLSLRLQHRHPMKPKEFFNLAVRLLGLIFLYHGLREAPLYVSTITTAFLGAHLGGLIWSLLHTAWPFAIAYWLLRGAPLLMRIAYPHAGSRAGNGREETAVDGQKSDASTPC